MTRPRHYNHVRAAKSGVTGVIARASQQPRDSRRGSAAGASISIHTHTHILARTPHAHINIRRQSPSAPHTCRLACERGAGGRRYDSRQATRRARAVAGTCSQTAELAVMARMPPRAGRVVQRCHEKGEEGVGGGGGGGGNGGGTGGGGGGGGGRRRLRCRRQRACSQRGVATCHAEASRVAWGQPVVWHVAQHIAGRRASRVGHPLPYDVP